MNIIKSLLQVIENVKKQVYKSFDFLCESICNGGVFGLIIATIIWVSIFSYLVFYYFYMPHFSYTRQVHLQFKSCETGKGVCSYPSAHVQLTKMHQLLMVGQKYKIMLSLEMPESPANIDLGMFMVCARLVDKSGFLVSHSCRSSMLHYQSYVLKFLIACVNVPFLIFGGQEEKQTLLVELYSDFEDYQGHPVTDIYVEIQSRFIELYSATVHIQAHLSGLRYLMFYWPILTSILGVLSNLFVISFIFSLSWYHLYMKQELGSINLLKYFKNILTLNLKKLWIWGNKDNAKELRPVEEICESSSDSDDNKSEVTREDLNYYLEAED